MRYIITALDILSIWAILVLVGSFFAGELKFPNQQSIMNAAAIVALIGVNGLHCRK